MRKYASAEERGAKNQKTTVRHFGFTEKVYGFPCTVCTLWKRRHRNATVGISFFLQRAIAVEARRRRPRLPLPVYNIYLFINLDYSIMPGEDTKLNRLSFRITQR